MINPQQIQCPSCLLWQQETNGICRRCNENIGLSCDDTGTMEPEAQGRCQACGLTKMYDLGTGFSVCPTCGHHVNHEDIKGDNDA